ncbi:uroporphyrinogen-III synthase [Parasphingorhabdus sp.]|uniref:uroporphyrinogen-III synthase n=1 Tax=Parasphingorhabdus sp. TaxID=2709688 RepID=UPI003002CF75
MSLPVLILRPKDGARQTELRAENLGLKTVVDPLFAVEPVLWSAPSAADFDALLLTSANAVDHGGPQLDAFRALPVLAVGEATASTARAAGFQVAETGNAGAQQLLEQRTADRYGRLLWLAGEQHSDLDPGARRLDIIPVYRSAAVPLGAKAVACLHSETIVLLHSARAAQHLASEMDRLQIPRGRHQAVVFSGKVAKAAGRGWRSVHTASRPDDDALLSLASGLCQKK